MKRYLYFFFLLGICFTQANCNSKSHSATDIFADMVNKTIIFPDSMKFSIYACQDVEYNIKPGNLKVLLYADSSGCVNCKLKLYNWKPFISEVTNIVSNNGIVFCFIFQPKTMAQIERMLKDNGFSYPVCIDRTDEFNRLNHLPTDERFHCFLLDENNRVILIGNPVQNPKIKDLYIRTICERLGIEYVHNPDENPRISLGTIKKDEPKNVCFEIRNDDNAMMKIDSIYTSCECTMAKMDKTAISRREIAILSVTYTPDGVGEFYREVYVKISGEEKPRVFAIEGKTE